MVLEFKWRSSLSASIRTTISGSFEKPFVKSYSIYYEIIYTHLAYAFTLSNMARKKITNDSSDEVINAVINDLCKGTYQLIFLVSYFCIYSGGNISSTFHNIF